MKSYIRDTNYSNGLSVGSIVVLLALVVVVAGFFFYRGARIQDEALNSELFLPPPPTPSAPSDEVMTDIQPPIEIGAEDEMKEVPEGAMGAGGNTSSSSDVDEPVEARLFREVNITGKNFAFSQTEIQVKKGDFVRINFKSTDGLHDVTIDAFNAKTDRVSTGNSSSVDFGADKAGTFEFYCSVGNHRQMGMIGKLIVEE